MSDLHPRRRTLFASSIALPVSIGAVAVIQPACGRTPVTIPVACAAYKYSVVHTIGTNGLLAIRDPGTQQQQIFEFTAPSVFVNAESHQAILDDYGGARAQLRLVLADAARELCRSTLEGEDSAFDFRTDPSNCADDYDPTTIQYDYDGLHSVVYDAADPPSVLPLECSAMCLIDGCSYGDTGDFDPAPEHPLARTVACECKIERIGDCENEEEDVYFSVALEASFVEHYCVPEGALPADYCRTSIADYFRLS